VPDNQPDAPKARSAGVRKPDRLAAGLDSKGIVDAAKATHELETTTRVYVRQWLVVGRLPSGTEADELLHTRFHERLLPSDTHVAQDELDGSWLALARLWSPAGEFRNEDDAKVLYDDIVAGTNPTWTAHTLRRRHDSTIPPRTPLSGRVRGASHDDQVRAVTLNSRAEHELKNVGLLKLPAAVLASATTEETTR
jgi:hypothetical protein